MVLCYKRDVVVKEAEPIPVRANSVESSLQRKARRAPAMLFADLRHLKKLCHSLNHADEGKILGLARLWKEIVGMQVLVRWMPASTVIGPVWGL